MQSDSVGVERRRLPFTLIENVILEDQALGPVDILVYLALAKHADGEGVCWPSLATIGKACPCASLERRPKHQAPGGPRLPQAHRPLPS